MAEPVGDPHHPPARLEVVGELEPRPTCARAAGQESERRDRAEQQPHEPHVRWYTGGRRRVPALKRGIGRRA